MNVSSMTEPDDTGRRGIRHEFGWLILVTVIGTTWWLNGQLSEIKSDIRVIELRAAWSSRSMGAWVDELRRQNPSLVIPSTEPFRRPEPKS